MAESVGFLSFFFFHISQLFIFPLFYVYFFMIFSFFINYFPIEFFFFDLFVALVLILCFLYFINRMFFCVLSLPRAPLKFSAYCEEWSEEWYHCPRLTWPESIGLVQHRQLLAPIKKGHNTDVFYPKRKLLDRKVVPK